MNKFKKKTFNFGLINSSYFMLSFVLRNYDEFKKVVTSLFLIIMFCDKEILIVNWKSQHE